jgi:hypothetical protein
VTRVECKASSRRAVVVAIMLVIAAAHIVGIGRYLEPRLPALYSGYFSDLVLPFGFYFLLFLPEAQWRFLARSEAKAAAVLAMASGAETLQYFGVWALGLTFDPIDFVMYAIGVISAAFVDTQVLARVFAFWRTDAVSFPS